MAFVRAAVALAAIAATFPAPILLLALRSAAVVAVFSPVSRFSRYFGFSALLRTFSFFFLGYTFSVAFFRSACLFSSSLSPPVASFVCFSCWPPSLLVRVWLWGPA